MLVSGAFSNRGEGWRGAEEVQQEVARVVLAVNGLALGWRPGSGYGKDAASGKTK